VISFRYELPNWLVLNFGYHNAHHAKPTAPWYRLPALHRELFGDDPTARYPAEATAEAVPSLPHIPDIS
jgi:omega-6 fatty acid desaturase (delta-12 desaturase)